MSSPLPRNHCDIDIETFRLSQRSHHGHCNGGDTCQMNSPLRRSRSHSSRLPQDIFHDWNSGSGRCPPHKPCHGILPRTCSTTRHRSHARVEGTSASRKHIRHDQNTGILNYLSGMPRWNNRHRYIQVCIYMFQFQDIVHLDRCSYSRNQSARSHGHGME